MVLGLISDVVLSAVYATSLNSEFVTFLDELGNCTKKEER
jgi:hypothetical protein